MSQIGIIIDREEARALTRKFVTVGFFNLQSLNREKIFNFVYNCLLKQDAKTVARRSMAFCITLSDVPFCTILLR